MTTRVLNIADRPPTWPRYDDVYVGRNVEYAVACGMDFPVWGNPFRGPTRELAISQYEALMYRRLRLNRTDATMLRLVFLAAGLGPLAREAEKNGSFLVGNDLRTALAGLDGKKLWCHCAPKPCHGDVLVKLAAEVKAGTL